MNLYISSLQDKYWFLLRSLRYSNIEIMELRFKYLIDHGFFFLTRFNPEQIKWSERRFLPRCNLKNDNHFNISRYIIGMRYSWIDWTKLNLKRHMSVKRMIHCSRVMKRLFPYGCKESGAPIALSRLINLFSYFIFCILSLSVRESMWENTRTKVFNSSGRV